MCHGGSMCHVCTGLVFHVVWEIEAKHVPCLHSYPVWQWQRRCSSH